MSVVRRFISERELAETYGPDEGWQTVEQYREAHRRRKENPDLARAEIARRVNRPASAVRGWLVEDKTPRVLSALNVADQRGWLDIESTSEQFRALNQLVAWIYSGGGVAERTFTPHFSVDDSLTLSTVHKLLGLAGISYRIDSDRPSRGTVVVPSQAASVFGRVLCVLGAPVGVKANNEQIQLPDYLSALPQEFRRDFLRVYVLNRGRDIRRPNTAGTYLHSLKSETLCKELKSLIESVTTGTATVGSKTEVWISAASVRDLAGGEPVRPALATKVALGSLTPPTERAFASTYRENESPGGYRYLQLYEQVRDSDKTAHKLMKQIDDLTLSSAQSWDRGSRPYVARGTEKARELGWITPPAEGKTTLALTSLVSWSFARASIRSDTYYPAFTIASCEQRRHFEEIADTLDLSYKFIREGGSNQPPSEARPADNSAILGRVLSVLGAPLGKKSESNHLLPTYLYYSFLHARRFIETWCKHYASGDEKLTITVPPRLGERFADGLEILLAEQLCWQTTRIGEREFETIRGGSI
jgi:hypothetical protein